MSLKLKITLSVILIISLISIASLYFLQQDFGNRISNKIANQFTQSQKTFNSFIDQKIKLLDQAIAISAYGSTFAENIKTKDEATIRQAIADAHEQVGGIFDIMVVLDTDLKYLSFFHFQTGLEDTLKAFAKDVDFSDHPVINDLFESDIFRLRTVSLGERLYQVLAAPVENEFGELGYLIIGQAIDNFLADELQKSIGTDFSFFKEGQILGTSLQKQKRLSLESHIAQNASYQTVLEADSNKTTEQLKLFNENYLITYQPLDNSNKAYYVLALSYDKEFETFKGLQTIILIIGSAAILVGIIFSLFFGNTITKPIDKLVVAVEEIEKENYHVEVPVTTKDEIGKLTGSFNHMAKGLGERFELLKFVSKNTIGMIQEKGIGNLDLGGVRKYMTIFFSDIRGFTSFSEKREPEEVIEMLNLYLKEQAVIVQKHNGDIDKFVGDELMAVFEGENSEQDAVDCAKEIQHKMNDLNKEYDLGIFIGIGINAGEVVSGNMGSEDRIDHTVLGNHVNLAARLCSKADAQQIIVSEPIEEKLLAKTSRKPLEPIHVKGISGAVQIFEIIY